VEKESSPPQREAHGATSEAVSKNPVEPQSHGRLKRREEANNMAEQGEVFERSGSWYLRYYRDDFTNGQTVRKRLTKKLVRSSDEFRTKKAVPVALAGSTKFSPRLTSAESNPKGR
jgi:hypothetical protein